MLKHCAVFVILFLFPLSVTYSAQQNNNIQQAQLAANYTKSHQKKDALVRVIDVESIGETLYITLQSSILEEGAPLSYGFVKAYCLDRQTRDFLNAGITYYIFIFDMSLKLIAEFSIDKNKCS